MIHAPPTEIRDSAQKVTNREENDPIILYEMAKLSIFMYLNVETI